MRLSKFNFELPETLIAQKPYKKRDDAKMMVVHRDQEKIEHRSFRDILEYFSEGDVMVANTAKVFPAMLHGYKEKTGAAIDVFMLRELNNEYRLWDVLVDPARKIRVGNKLFFGNEDLVAEVIDNTTSRGRTIRFIFDGTDDEFKDVVNRIGKTPLPNYIKRKPNELDAERYQSIFAKHEGAIAPPNAALHFTQAMKMRLEILGVDFQEVNVTIGLGSFRNVEVEDLSKHKMDSEYINVPEKTSEAVNNAKQEKKKVCAIGSSVYRAMESSVSAYGTLNPFEGWSDILMYPPYEYSIPNAFLTNFHRPLSPQVMLTASFIDNKNLWKEVYSQAVKKKYKFQCYGDALLIL